MTGELINREDAGVEVTAVIRLKHADLHRAAVRLGSMTKLAEVLGVTKATMYKWGNLQGTPPDKPNGYWNQEKLDELKDRLQQVTGKSYDKLFPKALRENAEFLKAEKTAEQTRELSPDQMSSLAYATEQKQLTIENLSDQLEQQEARDAIEEAMSHLTSREQVVIRMRFSENMTLRECAKELGCTGQNVRLIESKAIRKLQIHHGTYGPQHTGGVLAVSHKEEVIFRQEVEFTLDSLPELRPTITIDRRISDKDDDAKYCMSIIRTLLETGKS